VAGLLTSTEKVIKRGERIEALEFEQKPAELPIEAVPLRRPA